jgi:hypothetical protein
LISLFSMLKSSSVTSGNIEKSFSSDVLITEIANKEYIKH